MKSKKIVLVAHCVLNQNSVIEGWARASGAFPIAEILIKEGVGIMQLPCPEIIFNQLQRPPLSYDDYNNEDYRKLSRNLISPFICQLKNYIENNYKILGIIGINNSPSCSISKQRGVFMEELFNVCQKEKINMNYMEIPDYYTQEKQDEDLTKTIYKFIEKSN